MLSRMASSFISRSRRASISPSVWGEWGSIRATTSAWGSRPSISSITARTDDGEVIIARHDLERVTITRPGSPEPQVVTMARREPISTLDEELRRLTPDLVYQEVLASLLEEPLNG